MLHIDANRRVDIVFSYLANLNKERIAAVALPLLSLNPTTALVSSVAATFYRFYNEKDVKKTDLALFAGSTALTIFCPQAQLFLSGALALGIHGKQLLNGNNSAASLFHLTDQVIHLASVHTNSPLLVMGSLVLQAAKEIHAAYEFSQHAEGPRYPELCTHLLLAAVRLHKARSYLDILMPPEELVVAPSTAPEPQPDNAPQEAAPVPEEEPKAPPSIAAPAKSVAASTTAAAETPPPQPLKQLTTADVKALCKQIERSTARVVVGNPVVDVTELLQKNGFSLQIENVDFSKRTFANTSWKGLSFTNCVFRKTSFKSAKLENVTFDQCNFIRSYWGFSGFKQVSFNACTLVDASFHNAILQSVSWHASSLERAIFYRAYMQNPVCRQCNLQESNFLFASFLLSSRGTLEGCDLTNALLLDTKPGFTITGGKPNTMTKPVVALGWHFGRYGPGYVTPVIARALRENGAVVMQYEQVFLPPSITISQLVQDVQTGMSTMPKDANLATHIISNPNLPEIAKVRAFAQTILKHSQGLVLPGGDDVPAYFYNPFKLKKLRDDFEFQRTALELALLYEAQQRKIPTMGVCRGAQLINVFFGGTLRNLTDEEDGDSSFQPLMWTSSPYGDQLRRRLNTDFSGISLHSQAADRLGKEIHVVLERNGIPKLFVSEDGNFLASQFHPELYTKLLEDSAKKLNLNPEQIPSDPGKQLEFLTQAVNQISSQFSSDPFIQGICNHALKELKDLETVLQSISSNREIYRFFIDKFRTEQDSNLRPPA